MAYYRLSQVLKMRSEVMEHSIYEYDVDGPSFMTVYRLEKGDIRVKEKTYRSLSRAMGEEESTRQGVLKTKDIRVLWLTNEISNAFLKMDYGQVEVLLAELESKLDYNVKRNRQYLDYVKAKLYYKKGIMSKGDYENVLRIGITYGEMDFDRMLQKRWPFHEREWQMLLGIVEVVRENKDYSQQRYLLEQLVADLGKDYMEAEFTVAYEICVRWRISDVLGNMEFYREAIAMDEKTLELCEERNEKRYLAEVYYSIFWSYWMLKKKETLTEQEEARCKECLLKAYYISKAWYRLKPLYEKRMKECYPDELR